MRFAFFLFVFSFSVSAQTMSPEMIKMLKEMKIDKAQVSKMLESLQKSGRITKEQAAGARKKLAGLNEKELNKYKNMAVEKVESGDANRIIKHDYTKGTPKLNAGSVIEKKEPVKVDFSKLGQ